MVLLMIFGAFVSGCQQEIQNVSFKQDVHPLLRQNCYDCHSNSSRQGDLNLEGFDNLIAENKKRTKAPLIIPGQSGQSYLYITLVTKNSSLRMPPAYLGRDKLPDSEINIIKKWIDEGAKNN